MGFDPRPIAFKPSRPTDYTKDAVASTALDTTGCTQSMFTDIFFIITSVAVGLTGIMWSSYFHVICMVYRNRNHANHTVYSGHTMKLDLISVTQTEVINKNISVNIDLLQAVVPKAVLATASLVLSVGHEGLKAMGLGSNPMQM